MQREVCIDAHQNCTYLYPFHFKVINGYDHNWLNLVMQFLCFNTENTYTCNISTTLYYTRKIRRLNDCRYGEFLYVSVTTHQIGTLLIR